ncbi:MAG: hypothetical protein OXT67_05115 [Zetaproteobacteria bacterium]|nr:hypothetical protein [Zetaproteobacteria bacterium]
MQPKKAYYKGLMTTYLCVPFLALQANPHPLRAPLLESRDCILNLDERPFSRQLPPEVAELILSLRDTQNIRQLDKMPFEAPTLAAIRTQLGEHAQAALHTQAPDLWLKLHADILCARAGHAALEQEDMPDYLHFIELAQRTNQQSNLRREQGFKTREEWIIHGYTLLVLKYFFTSLITHVEHPDPDDSDRNTPLPLTPVAEEIRCCLTATLLPLLYQRLGSNQGMRGVTRLSRNIQLKSKVRQEAAAFTHELYRTPANSWPQYLQLLTQKIKNNIPKTRRANAAYALFACKLLLAPSQPTANSPLYWAAGLFSYLLYQNVQVKSKVADTQAEYTKKALLFQAKVQEMLTALHLTHPEAYARMYTAVHDCIQSYLQERQHLEENFFTSSERFQAAINDFFGTEKKPEERSIQEAYLQDIRTDLQRVHQGVLKLSCHTCLKDAG